MQDANKTKEQLIRELAAARQRVAELEAQEGERRGTGFEKGAMPEAPQESERRFRAIFEQSPLGIALTDSTTGHYLEANLKHCEIVGLIREEMLKTDFQTITHPNDLQTDLDNMRRLIAGEIRGFNMEKRYVRPDGSIAWVNLTVVPMWEEGEPHIRHLAMVEDITERKRAQEALERSEAQFRGLVERTSAGIATTDLEGRFTFVNEALCKMIGYSEEELIGSPFAGFLHPDDMGAILELFRNASNDPMAELHLEFRVLHKKGHTVYCYSSPTISWYQSEIAGFSAIIYDITERKRAELALKTAKDFTENLIQTANTIIVALDIHGNLQIFNQAAEEITGYTWADLEGKNWFEVLVPKDRYPYVWEEFSRLLQGGLPIKYENPILTKSGEERYIVWRNNVIVEQGRIAGTISFGIDITERKRAEETLWENEERLEFVLEGSQQGFWDWNIETGEVKRNKRWAEMLGYTLQEIEFTVKQWTDLIHPDDQAAAMESIQDHLEGRTPVHEIEYRMRARDGQYKWILDRARIVKRDPQGHPLRMSGTHTDVTERRRAMEEIHHQAQTLAALHETALDLAAQRSLPDLLQAIVARAVDLLAAREGSFFSYRPATDDLERTLDYNTVPEPDPRWKVLRRGEGVAGRVLESGRSLAVDDYNRWAGRLTHYDKNFAILGVPICWGDQPLGVLTVQDDAPRAFSPDDIALLERFAPLAAAALENNRLLRDLQEQMDKLQQTQVQLVQAAKLAAVGELAAGVAHELNNPLTSVLGFAELLLNTTPPDAPSRHDLEIIAKQAQRARDIVRSLLNFARQNKPQRQPTDVNQILRQTLDLIRQHIEKSGVTIIEDYAPDLDLVTLDSGQMKQVFLNLITNAAHAMPKGGTLRLRTARLGDEVAVLVSDTGVGIPPEIQEHIFEPFFTTKSAGQGTGLGLSISLGIVQEHGGRITVESQVEQPAPGSEPGGSTFTVWLPIETVFGPT
jgi:PAS domain S-box-containing protein